MLKLSAAASVLLVGVPCMGADKNGETPALRDLLARAERAMGTGEFDSAIASWREAESLMPDSPQLAYNQGVAWYRKGDYAKAADAFSKAATATDPELSRKARFNLGNCAYATALAKEKDPKAALEDLRVATSHYRDVLRADPTDADARANIETAQRLVKMLLEKQKEQQQSDENKDDKKKDPTSKPESQPESQPSSKPGDEDQQQDKKDQNSDKSPDQKKGDQQKDQKQEGKESQDGKQGQQDQKGEKKPGDDKGKLEKAQQGKDQDSKDQKDGQEQQAQQVPATQRAMTPEEIERLLQMIRDQERARMTEQMRRQRARQAPVEKDW